VLADNDTGFLESAATKEFDHSRFPNRFRAELCMHILNAANGFASNGR